VRIGIDLGGTKIEGIALSDAGEELARVRVDTPRSFYGTLQEIEQVVRVLEQRTRAIGADEARMSTR
jgi:fructokinase